MQLFNDALSAVVAVDFVTVTPPASRFPGLLSLPRLLVYINIINYIIIVIVVGGTPLVVLSVVTLDVMLGSSEKSLW